MAASDITVNVIVERRSLWGLIRRTPLLWVRHYREFRRMGNGRILSAYAAWLIASRLVTFGR